MTNTRFLFLFLIGVFFLIMPGCKAENNVPAVEIPISSELQSGQYDANGDYVWKYILTSDAKIGKPNLIDLLDESKYDINIEEVKIQGSKCKTYIALKAKKESILEGIILTPSKCVLSLAFENAKSVRDTLDVYNPLPEHPRLLVRKHELEQLRSRFNHVDFDELRAVFNQQKAYETNGIIQSDRPDERVRQKMEALALSYLLDKNTDDGLSAISIAINYLTSYAEHRKEVQTDYNYNLQTYEAVFGAALVYDWCYDLLTEQQKNNLIRSMKEVCLLTEYGIPDGSKKQYLSGHYGEYAPTISLAMGIAIYDEERSMLEMAYKEQVEGFGPSRNKMIPSGTHHQGAQYIHVRGSNELLQHFILNKLNASPYNPDIYKMTYRAIYGMIPQSSDMDGMPEGDCHNHVEMGNSQLFYLSANLSDDPYLQDISKKMIMSTKHQSARVFIYHNPEKPSVSISDAPLSRFFPSPSGMMIARTGWDMGETDYNSETMVVLMNMREYSAQNHTHMDLGHFSIYYKGHLALDAGIYQGKDPNNGWGKTNYVNYYSRTIAHNSLLIFDPNEPKPMGGWKVAAEARDGGQFFKAPYAWDNSQEMFDAGPSGTLLAHEIAPGKEPDYTYLKGDITEAYKVPDYLSNYPSKVETVRRSFVFLNHKTKNLPGTLIVLDKVVSTNPTFKKTWLLHTQNQPTVNGITIESSSTQKGRNGKLVTTVLIPDKSNANIELVGGAGKEYWVDGRNYGTVTQEDAGCWRVEVSPINKTKSDNFLHVIQTMSATHSAQTVKKAYSSDGEYVAVEVGDYLVMQNLNLCATNKAVEMTIGDASRNYTVIITDLEPGEWSVKSGAGQFVANASDNGVLTFESCGGDFLIMKD